MNTRRFSAVPLITAAIMALAAGCSTAGSNAASTTAAYKPEEPDITVAAIPAVDLVGLYIAQDDGLFAQQGLHVTIEKIPSSQAIIADQLKGQVDITAGSYVAYISAQAAGARFRILAEASILGPGTRALVTTAASPITTIAGLAGRKIGVNGINSIGTLLVSALLAEHGISPEKVDFATLNFPIDGYVATQAWAQKYPKTAAAFMRAIEGGQTIANSDAAAVQAAMAQYDKLPPQVTAAMVQSGYPTGPVNETHIQRVALAMLQFGMLGKQYATEVERGTLVESMVSPGS
jgi:NitT/TauT family transport system substrate-binding protein